MWGNEEKKSKGSLLGISKQLRYIVLTVTLGTGMCINSFLTLMMDSFSCIPWNAGCWIKRPLEPLDTLNWHPPFYEIMPFVLFVWCDFYYVISYTTNVLHNILNRLSSCLSVCCRVTISCSFNTRPFDSEVRKSRLASHCGCSKWFVSGLVGNLKYRFLDETHFSIYRLLFMVKTSVFLPKMPSCWSWEMLSGMTS